MSDRGFWQRFWANWPATGFWLALNIANAVVVVGSLVWRFAR